MEVEEDCVRAAVRPPFECRAIGRQSARVCGRVWHWQRLFQIQQRQGLLVENTFSTQTLCVVRCKRTRDFCHFQVFRLSLKHLQYNGIALYEFLRATNKLEHSDPLHFRSQPPRYWWKYFNLKKKIAFTGYWIPSRTISCRTRVARCLACRSPLLRLGAKKTTKYTTIQPTAKSYTGCLPWTRSGS